MRERWLAQRSDSEDRVGGYSIAALTAAGTEAFAPDNQTGFDESRRQAPDVGVPHRSLDGAFKFARADHRCDCPEVGPIRTRVAVAAAQGTFLHAGAPQVS